MPKIKVLFFSFLFLFGNLTAQTASELLRYTDLRPGGTARTIGIGGAISALGADYASLSSNPAGVAAFRKSEFVLSLGQLNTATESTLNDNPTVSDKKGNFNLETLGFVFFTKPKRKENWKAFNMAFGLNRLANFNRRISYNGIGNSSILESFAELASGTSVDELFAFDTQLAYDLSAIDEDANDPGNWFTYDDFSLGSIRREESLTTTGGINELVFSLGGNFNDRLLMGMTLGAPLFNYDERRIYTESDPDQNIPEFESLTYEERLTTSGIGVNLKAGIIFRLNPKIRFGASLQTPTSFGVTDNFRSSLAYSFINGEGTPTANLVSDERESGEGTFDYSLKTPWRAAGGVAVVVNKLGFLSAEIEYLDYTRGKFNLTANRSDTQIEIEEQNLNDEIVDAFTSVVNLKVGGEFALKKWRLRAGYALNPTAFVSESEQDDLISLGLGFRGKDFYLDAAYRFSSSDQGYLPYNVNSAPQPVVNNKINQNKLILTFGYRF